jgi:hypothetical protein
VEHDLNTALNIVGAITETVYVHEQEAREWRRVFRHVDQCKIRCSTAAPSHAEIIPGYDDGEAVSVNEIVFRAFNDYEGEIFRPAGCTWPSRTIRSLQR